MGTFSIWHWLIVLAIVVLLFGGAGRIPRLMGDMAKGVKAFKSGMKDEGENADNAAASKQVTDEGTTTTTTVERDKNVA
jgi:sec-independent protein translocase protein TatA